MKSVLIAALLFASCALIPLTGCVVHEHDRAYHDDHYRHTEVIREEPHPVRHDDIHVDVHP